MEKLISQIKSSLIMYLGVKPQDIPYLISGNKVYTAQELAIAIENNDNIGIHLIRNANNFFDR